MTTFMRWLNGDPDRLEYFEPSKARWVASNREMYAFFLKDGPVHMNPTVNPAVALLAEMQALAPGVK